MTDINSIGDSEYMNEEQHDVLYAPRDTLTRDQLLARLDEAERETRKLDRALRVVLEEYGWSPGAIDIYIRGLEDASDSPA